MYCTEDFIPNQIGILLPLRLNVARQTALFCSGEKARGSEPVPDSHFDRISREAARKPESRPMADLRLSWQNLRKILIIAVKWPKFAK